eukprot:1156480-Pelagomonas_calceolata.AAC.9
MHTSAQHYRKVSKAILCSPERNDVEWEGLLLSAEGCLPAIDVLRPALSSAAEAPECVGWERGLQNKGEVGGGRWEEGLQKVHDQPFWRQTEGIIIWLAA